MGNTTSTFGIDMSILGTRIGTNQIAPITDTLTGWAPTQPDRLLFTPQVVTYTVEIGDLVATQSETDGIKYKLAAGLTDEMIKRGMILFSKIPDPITLTTKFHARAFVAPSQQVQEYLRIK